MNNKLFKINKHIIFEAFELRDNSKNVYLELTKANLQRVRIYLKNPNRRVGIDWD